MMKIFSAFLVKEGSKESLKKRDEIWKYLRVNNPELAKMVNHNILGKPMQMHTYIGRKMIICGYTISRKLIGFS